MKFGVALLVLVTLLAACGGDDDGSSSSGESVCVAPPAPQKPAAACDVTIQLPPLAAVRHVPEGTPLTYCTTPPSSGSHFPVWAAFQEYERPVDWPYLVHSMEHGAIVLLYKCDAACPEIVDGLRRIRDAAPVDPMCGGSTPRRIIIAPSPASPPITTPVAAAAWGATYEAACVDEPTLAAFVRDHYAKGPEDTCSPGRVF